MDTKKVDACIVLFDSIRKALGTLQITSTRTNLDATLGCMQLCDRGIKELSELKNAVTEKAGESNGEQN